MSAVDRFTITIQGPNWEDVQEVELPELPGEGDAIETRYGTCIVTRAEPLPDSRTPARSSAASLALTPAEWLGGRGERR
jgi:hypothetical protein